MSDHKKNDEGELRRWVSNLQLESWQLELLITGFSIFLLGTSLQEYSAFESDFIFNKLSGQKDNPIFAVSARLIISAIPLALRFFLISLLVHLLLRGFWIGIVGLSSVSNKIDFDQINLQKPFKKFLPENVRTLDELILFLDKMSSVIFAYTYLVAFSLISVVLVGAFLFSIIGLTILVPNIFGDGMVVVILNIVLFFILLIMAVAAVIFFLDTLLFSSFKKSKWFSVLYYPIYRFYSIISISFLYRSIYYHLISNFKKKHITLVSLVLLVVFLGVNRVDNFNGYTYYPEIKEGLSQVIQNKHYDDQRNEKAYIRTASIPSKFVNGRYLEVFVRYDPDLNSLFGFLCAQFEHLEMDDSLVKSINAGIESQMDTTRSIRELLFPIDQYREDVLASLACVQQAYSFSIGDQEIANYDFSFTTHQNKGEKGFLIIIDTEQLEAGKHELIVQNLEQQDRNVFSEDNLENYKFETLARIAFWKE